MANAFKHKRYFRVRLSDDSSLVTFSSTDDAQTKIGFKSVWNTSSPTKSYALEDSGQTLVVTYEFDNASDQTAFKNAVDALMDDSSTPWDNYEYTITWTNKDTSTQDAPAYGWVEHFKTEWLKADGTTVDSTNAPMGKTAPKP